MSRCAAVCVDSLHGPHPCAPAVLDILAEHWYYQASTCLGRWLMHTAKSELAAQRGHFEHHSNAQGIRRKSFFFLRKNRKEKGNYTVRRHNGSL